MKKKLLILIVAYNHEKFIKKVLDRVDVNLTDIYDVEILINDDSSTDLTFQKTKEYIEASKSNFKYKILSNPKNLGYGGNQKIGFLYAINNNYDYVALVHGDGQYAPEYLDVLVEPLANQNIDAVFGSRMINKGGAIKGGMPLYKYVGNKILTYFQNKIFNKNFTEFHSGYRIYKVSSLKKIPFELNEDDHSFDNEIIIQFLIADLNIVELPIPTYYGEEISYVNGMKYAYQVFKANIKAKLQKLDILYDKKYDISYLNKEKYTIKKNYDSTHTRVLNIIPSNSKVLDLGCNNLEFAKMLKKEKNCYVTGVDLPENSLNREFVENYYSCNLNINLPNINYDEFDFIVILDVIEHLDDPENFLYKLKEKIKSNPKIKIIITTPNIAFIIIRLMLLFGNFNYGRRGILDKTHKRLFTFGSFKNLLNQNGYEITKLQGIPAPFGLALGENFFSKSFLYLNQILIFLSKKLFSYQIYCELKSKISYEVLLEKAKINAKNKR